MFLAWPRSPIPRPDPNRSLRLVTSQVLGTLEACAFSVLSVAFFFAEEKGVAMKGLT